MDTRTALRFQTLRIAIQGVLAENLGRYCVSGEKIEPGCIDSEKLSDESVTEQKLSFALIEKYGHLPYKHISTVHTSDPIAYDFYTTNGIYHFEGRYVPVTLFVLVGDGSNITQIRVQGDEVRLRAYINNEWSDWSDGNTEVTENLLQLGGKVEQLETEAQLLSSTISTFDQQFAGTVTIKTTNSYKMDTAQVIPGSEVLLTLINGPSTSCFVRSDYYPLYYYGTNHEKSRDDRE